MQTKTTQADLDQILLATEPTEDQLLRIVADDYRQSQKTRVAKGEQLRSIMQGRDQSDPTPEIEQLQKMERLGLLDLLLGELREPGEELKLNAVVDEWLKAVRTGVLDAPSRYLAESYRRAFKAERAAYDEMLPLLESHPAWEWMGQIRGIGPTLGAQLLARLDIRMARNASSFWKYCGLATVPGQRWHCEECGWTGIFPAGHKITGKHKGCKELAEQTHTAEDGIRAAQPKAEAGKPRDYDAEAKRLCYLLGTQWLKSGDKSFFAKEYRRKRKFYDAERAGWEDGRKHKSALRVTEKLFLSLLYHYWCEAIGEEPGLTYAEQELGHQGVVTPQEVLDWEAAAKAA